MAGEEKFKKYLRVVQAELLRMQNKDGSWPNTTGPGSTYGTATACLILQIAKKYLPIFQR